MKSPAVLALKMLLRRYQKFARVNITEATLLSEIHDENDPIRALNLYLWPNFAI